MYNAPKRLYAGLLLLILLVAYTGQKVHIYNEDHAHFAAHCGDLLPDNGAHAFLADKCFIDDFCLFPYVDAGHPVPAFYFEMLAVLLPEPTRCKSGMPVLCFLLRAPPVA